MTVGGKKMGKRFCCYYFCLSESAVHFSGNNQSPSLSMQIDWTVLGARPGERPLPTPFVRNKRRSVPECENEPAASSTRRGGPMNPTVVLEMYLILFNASIFHSNLVTF